MKQVGFCFVGMAAFFLVGHRDYAWLGRSSRWMWIHPVVWMVAITLALNTLVLVPHVGISKNGARRWLPMGFTQLQPSELAKWAVVLFLAWWMTRPNVDTRKFLRGFVPTLVPVAMICLLIVIQDFGTAALIAICALTMLLAGRIKWWHLAIMIPPVLLAAAWFIMRKEYRWRRMTAFTDPWANPQREGYHMIQSLLSFSTGGVTGRGLGNGIQKLGYLPEDTTDFIFAVVCEELGLFGALLTVAMYLGILYVAWQVVKQKRDDFGRMLAFGIGSMIGLQATINIAVATVSVPTKGLSLPLISAGGSGLVITCAALGLLYSISRHPHAAGELEINLPRHPQTPFDMILPEIALPSSPSLA
jgi:cell division protein FtsW